jgi:hypothetical protein
MHALIQIRRPRATKKRNPSESRYTNRPKALSQKVADFLDKIMRQNKEVETMSDSS